MVCSFLRVFPSGSNRPAQLVGVKVRRVCGVGSRIHMVGHIRKPAFLTQKYAGGWCREYPSNSQYMCRVPGVSGSGSVLWVVAPVVVVARCSPDLVFSRKINHPLTRPFPVLLGPAEGGIFPQFLLKPLLVDPRDPPTLAV